MSTILQQFDIVRVTLVANVPPQVSLNRFHYLVGPTVGSPTDVQFAHEFDTALAALFKACLCSGALYRGSMAQITRPVPSPSAATHFQRFAAGTYTGGSGVGTRGATPMPGQVRGLVAFKGVLASRGLNCRSYIPWPSTADGVADGFTPTASYQTAIGTFATGVVAFSSINDGSGNTALVSLVDFTPENVPNYVRENLTTSEVRPRWATQRRSGAYGRPNVPPI